MKRTDTKRHTSAYNLIIRFFYLGGETVCLVCFFEYIANLFCQFFYRDMWRETTPFQNRSAHRRSGEYLRRCKAGDEEARRILIEHNLRLVAHIVKNILQPQATTQTT